MAQRAMRLPHTPPGPISGRPDSERDLWRLAVNSLGAHVAVLDERGEVIAVNDAWRRFASAEGGASDYLGANYLAVCLTAGDPIALRVADGLRDVASGRAEEFECEYPCHSPLQKRWFVVRATRAPPGSGACVVVSHENVTERRLSQSSAELQALLLDEVNVAVHTVQTSNFGSIVKSWNAGAERLFGWAADEAIGRKPDDLIVPRATPLDPRTHSMSQEQTWEGDLVLARKDGSVFPAHVRSRLVDHEAGAGALHVVVTIDISERLRSERELRVARDHLRAVTDSVGEGLLTIDRTGRVTYMNAVAEAQLGWPAAELNGRDLHQVTHRHPGDGSPTPGDECPIMRACNESVTVAVDDDAFIRADGSVLEVSYTAAPFSTDQDVEGCVIVFRDVSARNAERRKAARQLEKLDALKRVRTALDDDSLILFSQPIVEIDSGRSVQQELLVRMQDPDKPGTAIPPGAFLPVAEEFGLIVEIDRWVIDRAADLAGSGTPVHVNVSGVSVGDPRLMDHITAALARADADPGLMVFEITETTLIETQDAGCRFVEGLHRLGCGVALDDFGTGYGGFTYLKRLPVDVLKIDMEFVRDLTVNPASQNVVEAIVNLARRFQVLTVAEGVEDKQTLELLRELGVDRAQGYHLGRPAPIQAANRVKEPSEGFDR